MKPFLFLSTLISSFLFPLLAAAQTPLVTCQDNCTFCDLIATGNRVVQYVTVIAFTVVVLYIAWSAIQMIISGGDESKFKSAKKSIYIALTGLVIILVSWVFISELLSILAGEGGTATPWNEIQCSVSSVTPASSAGGGSTAGGASGSSGSTASCQQSFSVSASPGCSPPGGCIDVGSYADSYNCASAAGACYLSPTAAARARALIGQFRQIASTRNLNCSLTISSAIQISGGPSASDCHKPGNSASGTCLDFNLSPYEGCRDAFYAAAADSGSVVSFLDEYNPACGVSWQTGDNIHVNF